jgi:hypothetical protein
MLMAIEYSPIGMGKVTTARIASQVAPASTGVSPETVLGNAGIPLLAARSIALSGSITSLLVPQRWLPWIDSGFERRLLRAPRIRRSRLTAVAWG